MKKLSILAILALLLLLTTLPAAAITWGELDANRHPNVGIMVAYNSNGEPLWRCSGTLIAPRVLLTADHCVSEPEGVDAMLVWFETDLGTLGYPDGGGTSVEGDPWPPDSDAVKVGLVILKEPVDIEPAEWPPPDLHSQLKEDGILVGGNEDVVAFRSLGYGSTFTSWPTPVTEDFDRLRWVFESEFIALTKTKLLLSQRTYDDGDVGFGDSGGPVFWVFEDDAGNEIETLVAVTGIGQGASLGNYRVDIPETLQWIQDQIDLVASED